MPKVTIDVSDEELALLSEVAEGLTAAPFAELDGDAAKKWEPADVLIQAAARMLPRLAILGKTQTQPETVGPVYFCVRGVSLENRPNPSCVGGEQLSAWLLDALPLAAFDVQLSVVNTKRKSPSYKRWLDMARGVLPDEALE